MTYAPLTILLAEDDEGHAELIRRNLERSRVINEIVHVPHGQEALDYIRRQGRYADRRQGPLIAILDIKMPVLDGVETLRQLKADARTAAIPFIMLTTTDDPREMEHCYQLGCNIYITKPVEYERFCEALRELGRLLQFVGLPNEAV
jgi:CheY-like chemotaxis protein